MPSGPPSLSTPNGLSAMGPPSFKFADYIHEFARFYAVTSPSYVPTHTCTNSSITQTPSHSAQQNYQNHRTLAKITRLDGYPPEELCPELLHTIVTRETLDSISKAGAYRSALRSLTEIDMHDSDMERIRDDGTETSVRQFTTGLVTSLVTVIKAYLFQRLCSDPPLADHDQELKRRAIVNIFVDVEAGTRNSTAVNIYVRALFQRGGVPVDVLHVKEVKLDDPGYWEGGEGETKSARNGVRAAILQVRHVVLHKSRPTGPLHSSMNSSPKIRILGYYCHPPMTVSAPTQPLISH
ncbi:hypothetical protein BD779DRAFT_1529983 [Infundibulicybe gibba]|nr:hypothetical protein BD779DRAFT_1529983 [Infundibulicybe gibba]